MKRLHKTEVVQEARTKHRVRSWVEEKRTVKVCLTLNSNLEARSETDTNKHRLLSKLVVKDILQLLEQREK